MGGAGPIKADRSNSLEASQVVGTQVLRKSSVQGAFKELYEYEQGRLAMRPQAPDAAVPETRTLADVVAAARDGSAAGWIVDPAALCRGDMFEAVVQLEAEDTFRVSAVMSAFVAFVEEDPSAFGIADPRAVREAAAGNRLLEQMLAGLVTVRGRLVDFAHVKTERGPILVHHRLLDQLSEPPTNAADVFVVGVAEQVLFWKDLRRVLFSGSRYSVLCRVGRDGLQDSWTPVKLVDVLREVSPDLAQQIGSAGPALLRSMAQDPIGSPSQALDADASERMRHALRDYASRLDGRGAGQSELPWLEQVALPASAGDIRGWFRDVSASVGQQTAAGLTSEAAAATRQEVMEAVGLTLDGHSLTEPPPTPSPPPASSTPTGTAAAYLDAEFIGIYW